MVVITHSGTAAAIRGRVQPLRSYSCRLGYRRRWQILRLLVLGCFFFRASLAEAAIWTWTGNGGNVNWSTAGNWDLGTAPPSSSTTDLAFGGTNNTGTALNPLFQNTGGTFQLNSLAFNSGAGSFFLGGGALAFTGAGNTISQFSSNAQSIANNITAVTNSTVTLTLTGTGSGTVTLSGNISSGGGSKDYAISKTGTSTFTLSGANTYGGLTTVSAGILNIQNNTGLGTTAAGTTVSSGATLQLQGGISVGTETLSIAGTGASGQTGALVNVSGTNGYGGLLTLTAATTLSSDGGTLNLTNAGTITGATFGLTLAGAGDGSISSIIGTTTGTLTKSGTGTWTLSGGNTYTGVTTVSAGVLNIQNNNGLGTTAAGTTVSNGATLQLQGGITVSTETLNINGTGASGETGALVNVSGTNNYGGLLTFAGATTLSSDSGTLNLTNAGTITGATFGLTLTGAANGSISSIIGTTTGSLTKNGAGTWTLSGANTFSGATTINGGMLTVAAGSGSALAATSSITVNSGGTLLLGANNQINNAATMTLAGGTFAKGDFTEGTAGSGGTSTLGLGALTLTAAGSHIDFGAGNVGTLSFASFTPGAYTLLIDDWTGTANTIGSASTDRLIFDSNQSGNLSSFWFAGYAPGATQFDLGGGYYEVTPVTAVPEPSTYAGGLLTLLAIGYLKRRQLGRLVRFKSARGGQL
jgi:fibronectin-binding autotransporter adhesin